MLYALRLIFDPTYSYADRQLSRDDFWDGLSDGSVDWDPMARREVIEASVEIVEFEDSPAIVTALADALIQEEPLRAKLTYRFAPLDIGEETSGVPKYRGRVYGGDNFDAPIRSDYREYLHFAFLHALRDVEADIRSWRRSPLRRLLEAAAAAVTYAGLGAVREAMKDANDQPNDLDVIRELGGSIGTRLKDMVGGNQAVETELAVAPDNPLKLIRDMRLYVDGPAHRGLSNASLGTLNVLYLALLELGLESRLLDSEIAHVVLAIDEPEAHLHPHLQRLVFRRLLTEKAADRSVMVTTQSPHIASVADPKSLVALRSVAGQTVLAAAQAAELSEAEWDDVRRYLDATRAEIVFARSVLLVEGFAEEVLVPKLAQAHGMDLDKLGVSVCAIHGTHFSTYARFCQALGIPWTVLTDGDTDDTGVKAGLSRATRVLATLSLSGPPADHGIFVGEQTFEYDVMAAAPSNLERCCAVLAELCAKPSRKIIASWEGKDPGYESFMKMITNAGGKGRYAQRLALHDLEPPPYIADALNYLAQ